MLDRILCLMLVFFGGGVGSLVRYLTEDPAHEPFTIANVSACFLIGIYYAITRYRLISNEFVNSSISLGFLGGLSTFTPIAIISSVSAQEKTLLAMGYLAIYLLAFIAIGIAGYLLCASYLKHIKKLQPLPSLSAWQRAQQLQEQALQAKEQIKANNTHGINKNKPSSYTLNTKDNSTKSSTSKADSSLTINSHTSSLDLDDVPINTANEDELQAMQYARKVAQEAYKKALEEKLHQSKASANSKKRKHR